MRGVKGFIGEVVRRSTGWGAVGILASLLSWIGIGEYWTSGTKTLVIIVILLLILLTRVSYVAYLLYMKVDRPLSVRKVSQGTHYFKDSVMVLLERCDTVAVGDILLLFVREGDAEVPICLISVETITNKSFPQGVVFHSFTEEPLLGYLSDESRIEQLQAKCGVTRRHLECLIMQ